MAKYMCALCGRGYDSAEAYAKCVGECSTAIKQREEQKRKEELEANRQKRIDEIRAAKKHVSELERKFINDYGFYAEIMSPFEILFG